MRMHGLETWSSYAGSESRDAYMLNS